MRVIKKVLFSLFLLVSLCYLFIVVSPRFINGFYPYGVRCAIVLTGSMEPTLNINDFVVVKKPKNIKVDDIISYRDNNSEVIHRVIDIKDDIIITKGDSNNKIDNPISFNKVTGIYVRKIPYLGKIIVFMRKPIVFSAVITLLFILFLIPDKKKDEGE